MKLLPKIALAVLGALAAIQIVQCERTNPPVTGDIRAPAEVKAILRRSCYDCHSNETVYPWYAYVAPASWLLHRDVVGGRKHLNFSEWSSLPADRREKKQRGSGKEVAKGEMPLWFYLPLHTNAKLSDADKKILDDWANGPVSD
jgi:hypothetical protein